MSAIDGPRSRFEALRAYQRADAPANVRLRLDANEGPPPALDLVLSAIREGGPELLRRYPDARPLQAGLATQFGVESAQVFVAAGADEVVDRCCRAFLAPGASMVMADPGFDMFAQYAAMAGARLVRVPWSAGDYPRDAVCRAIDDSVAMVAFITPNNPTGESASLDDLRAISRAAPRALIILDHAYVEFADEDLTGPALALPNVVVVRTFSKAWGLAGCRVGYAVGPSRIIRTLRAMGGPFPASAASLLIARTVLERGIPLRNAYVSRIKLEREALFTLLAQLGGRPRRSNANFVFCEFGSAATRLQSALAQRGIVTRLITNSDGEPLGLRISLPGNSEDFALLTAEVERVLTGIPA